MIISSKNIMDIVQRRATAIELQEPVRRIRRKIIKTKIKASTFAIYASVFVLVIVIAFTSYQSPKNSSVVANVPNVSAGTVEKTSVDDVVATNVAATVAKAANLPIANNVANLAVSTKVKNEIIQLNSTFRSIKIGSSVEGRSVTSYTVQSGDTLDSLAARFGITVQTIKWANNLTQDALYEGESLQILPVNGVVYDVKFGDTIDSLATKYQVNRERLILYNDLDVSGLTANTKIILPDATLPEDERPGYISPYSAAYGYNGGNVTYLSTGGDFNSTIKSYIPQVSSFWSSTPGNTMWYGQCTWWAWERRYAMGKPLPSSNLGDGGVWAYQLGSSKNPSVGDVAESSHHVSVVEGINYDSAGNISSITISEMNYAYRSFYVNLRTIPAANIGDFNYIR